MAKAEELDLDTKKESSTDKKKGGLKLILLIVGAVLLVSGAVLGTMYFTGMLGGGHSKADAGKHNETPGKAEQKQAAVPSPANYFDMKPVLVSNFEDTSGGVTYLQIDMQLMARDPHALDIAKLHMPVIRNNLLLIMSAQKVADVKTRAGKEKLQQTMLEAIQKIIADAATGSHDAGHDAAADAKDKSKANTKEHEEVKTANIDAVYFTSFIMQ